MIKLKYIGQDDWSQDLYQGPDRKKYVYVDGSIYTMTKEGEPLAKVNFEYELERPKNESNDESSAIQAQIISIICGTFERDGSIKSWKMKEKSEPGPPQFESFDETDFDSVITRATKRFSVKGDRLIEDLLERIGKGEMTITEAAEHIIKADVSTAPMLMIEPHPDMFRHRFPIHEAMNSRWKPDIQKIYSRQIDAAVQDYRMMTEPELKKFCDMANKEEMISDGYFDRSDGFSNESQRKKVTEKLVKYMKSCLNGNPFDESINESSAPHFAARLEAFLDAPWQEDQEIYFVSDLRAALQKAGINDLGAAHPDKAKAVVRNMNSGIAGIRLQFMGDRFLDSLTSICESNGHLQPVSDDIITAAIEIDLKPNLFVHTIKQDGVHVEFGANVKMSTIEKLAEELRKMGRDVKATRGQASIVVNESLLTEGTAEELTAKLIDAGLPSDAFSIVYAPDSRKFAAIVQDGHRREAEQALTKAKIRYTQKARGRFVLNESSNEMTDDQIIRWIKDLDMPKQKTDRVIGHALEYHPKPKGPSELKEIVDDVLAKMGEKQFNESLITEAASGATCMVYCEQWRMETDQMTVQSPSGKEVRFNPNFAHRGPNSDLIGGIKGRYWDAYHAYKNSGGSTANRKDCILPLWLTREEMEACKAEAARQGKPIRESLINIPSFEVFEARVLMPNASPETLARDTEESDQEYIKQRQKRDAKANELFGKKYSELTPIQRSKIKSLLSK